MSAPVRPFPALQCTATMLAGCAVSQADASRQKVCMMWRGGAWMGAQGGVGGGGARCQPGRRVQAEGVHDVDGGAWMGGQGGVGGGGCAVS